MPAAGSLNSLPWRTAGFFDASLPPPASRPTFFARFGNVIPLLIGFALLIAGHCPRAGGTLSAAHIKYSLYDVPAQPDSTRKDFSQTMRNSYLFTSESVSEGHPDKVADQISDAIVDLFLSKDPEARVACETMTTTNRVVLGRRDPRPRHHGRGRQLGSGRPRGDRIRPSAAS